MILVDASIWIDHIRSPIPPLSRLLAEDLVLAHPMVIGEIALGSVAGRSGLLANLADLPSAVEAEHREVMGFIDNHGLFGIRIGYVDLHLIASCMLTPGASLWTKDKRLFRAADNLGLAYQLRD